LNFFKGSFAYRNKINQKAIVVDPVGATVISIYIIIMWIRQARGFLNILIQSIFDICIFLDQIQRLSGHTADPKFLSHITVNENFVLFFLILLILFLVVNI